MYINKIFNKKELRLHRKVYTITVKEGARVIYSSKSYAGVVSTVEQIKSVNDELEVEGTTQRIIFGHPIVSVFAFDQLRLHMEDEIRKVADVLLEKFKKHPSKMPFIKMAFSQSRKNDNK